MRVCVRVCMYEGVYVRVDVREGGGDVLGSHMVQIVSWSATHNRATMCSVGILLHLIVILL